MIKVFGHKSPDTDSTGSPIIWAWYLTEVKGTPATPVLLGEPNTEAAFVLTHWNLPKPEIIADVAAGDTVVIVDTNNPAGTAPLDQRGEHCGHHRPSHAGRRAEDQARPSTSPSARWPAPPPSCMT
jgi:nanoRNase/pAp phosphatase (c-di-AMP/oligoRNAs hydrolase)